MLNVFKSSLKAARKINSILSPDATNFGRNWKMFSNKEYASALIYEELQSDKPSMIARLGSNELMCVLNYKGVKYSEKKSVKAFVKGKAPSWWWEDGMIEQLRMVAGFFPCTIDRLEKFSELMIRDMPNVDILGSWRKEEVFFREELSNSKKVVLEDLEPFFTSSPWTKALANKKILVVHPFAETIQKQYLLKDKLFDNGLLPDFELITVKSVQSYADQKTPFEDWFSALEYMKEMIVKEDFDICILGCGAYGFPLASFVKNMGKKAIHLGGITQLLFGIKGKRWEEFIVWPYMNLFNEYWVRPGDTERPAGANKVEGACYW